MPQIKSAIKRVQIAERKRLYNKGVKSSVKASIKRVFSLVNTYAGHPDQNNLEEIQQALRQAFSRLDKASNKGVIHRNTAARRKARLARRVKEVTAPPTTGVA